MAFEGEEEEEELKEVEEAKKKKTSTSNPSSLFQNARRFEITPKEKKKIVKRRGRFKRANQRPNSAPKIHSPFFL
jgi:hypothetical protein